MHCYSYQPAVVQVAASVQMQGPAEHCSILAACRVQLVEGGKWLRCLQVLCGCTCVVD